MPRPLPFDLRIRILAAVARGYRTRAIGERFGVSAGERERLTEARPSRQGGAPG